MLARLPFFSRVFLRDAIEGAISAILVLPLVGDRDTILHSLVFAVGAAVVSSARRAVPGFVGWLNGVLNVPASGS